MTQTAKCSGCGELVRADGPPCVLCRTEPEHSHAPINRSVKASAAVWARSIVGAPRALDRLITHVDIRDQVIERIATEITRRLVREERAQTTMRAPTPRRVNPNTVDPFSISPDALRTNSEHITPCDGCAGSCTRMCTVCNGHGAQTCPTCSGTGKELKHYQKSSRYINCKSCRTTGRQPCDTCRSTGRTACPGCSGTGHHLTWLTYTEESAWYVAFLPLSPILEAHPQLKERRFLASKELEAFSVLRIEESVGPLPFASYRVAPADALRLSGASVDARIERVARQQYCQFSVVRREASYAMCGRQGRIIFSGRNLVAAPMEEAIAPIVRRRWLWAAASLALATLCFGVANHYSGSSSYFATVSTLVYLFATIGVLLGIPALGGLLREFASRATGSRLETTERTAGIGAIASVCALLAVGIGLTPKVSAVHDALSQGNTLKARTILTALKEKYPNGGDVREAESSVLFAESAGLTDEEKAETYEKIAVRGGSIEAQARMQARTARVSIINKLLSAKDGAQALTRIDAWYPASVDQELRGLRASALDLRASECQDDACRYTFAHAAEEAAPTDLRKTKEQSARAALLASLAARNNAPEAVLERLKRSRTLVALANATKSGAANDAELASAATSAVTWGEGERKKVALIGAERAVVAELLGVPLVEGPNSTSAAVVEGNTLALVFDQQKRCRGVYAVGSRGAARQLTGSRWTADRILSQALGKSVSVKTPVGGASSLRWYDGSPIVARWRSGMLVELRIGEATP